MRGKAEWTFKVGIGAFREEELHHVFAIGVRGGHHQGRPARSVLSYECEFGIGRGGIGGAYHGVDVEVW